MAESFAPEGWTSITPRLFVDDVAGMVSFLRSTFHAEGDLQAERPSEIKIGDTFILVSGTDARESMPACLYVYVDDADAVFQRAMTAGAETMEPPLDTPYGDRRCMVKDPWDNVWQIATCRRG